VQHVRGWWDGSIPRDEVGHCYEDWRPHLNLYIVAGHYLYTGNNHDDTTSVCHYTWSDCLVAFKPPPPVLLFPTILRCWTAITVSHFTVAVAGVSVADLYPSSVWVIFSSPVLCLGTWTLSTFDQLACLLHAGCKTGENWQPHAYTRVDWLVDVKWLKFPHCTLWWHHCSPVQQNHQCEWASERVIWLI